MAKANAYNAQGNESGTVDLPDHLFGGDVNEALVHQAVKQYLANQRQGTHQTKERSDVRGGGKKPYRQKGTGRARAGTIRSPIWRGGGTVFGPHPRKYTQAMNKKARRAALRSSLASRASSGDIAVIESLRFETPTTKSFANVLKNLGSYHRKTLVVLEDSNPGTVRSGRNIKNVRFTRADMVNPYDVMWADKVVITAPAMSKMEEVFK